MQPMPPRLPTPNSPPERVNGVCCTHSHFRSPTAMPKLLLLVVLPLSFLIGARTQTTQPPCSAPGTIGAQSIAVTRTGVGTPYSLTAIVKTEMTLSNGNTISGFTTSHQARDSQGRTRVENPFVCVMDKDHQSKWQGSITVTDPVAKT